MAEKNPPTPEPRDSFGLSATTLSGQPKQSTSFGLRLAPANNSDQPIVANISNVQLAPGMAYIDFGFIEPGVLAALPRLAQQGEKTPEQITGKLAARVVIGFDGLAQLHQQITRAMNELSEAAKRQNATA